jgi:hypothetical protein
VENPVLVVGAGPSGLVAHVQAYVVTRNARSEDAPDELLRDPTGALHKRLGAERPSLCLVRPDGHLGLRAEPPALAPLKAHLGCIFRSD